MDPLNFHALQDFFYLSRNCFFPQDLHLNRVVITESSPDNGATEHSHPRPKPTKTKSYDLGSNDPFWDRHRGRWVWKPLCVAVCSLNCAEKFSDKNASFPVEIERKICSSVLTWSASFSCDGWCPPLSLTKYFAPFYAAVERTIASILWTWFLLVHFQTLLSQYRKSWMNISNPREKWNDWKI